MHEFGHAGFIAFAAALAFGCSAESNAPTTDEGPAQEPGPQAGATGTGGSMQVATEDAGRETPGSGGARPGDAAPGAGGSAGGGTGGGGAGGGASKEAGSGGAHPVVTPCNALGEVGKWQEITPPGIDLTVNKTTSGGDNFGTAALKLNPQDPAQIYLGTETWGFYGSKDCGATWSKLNTGRSAADMDHGNQWTMAVDPVEPNIIYSNSGFATGGVFKSTNGGVDWDNVLTAASVKGSIPFSAIPYSGFIGTYSMDPNDRLHLVSSFHSQCNAPAAAMCFIETLDGGATWTVRNIVIAGVGGGEHTLIEFLTSTRWLFGTQGGVFISEDSGSHWTQIPGTHSIVHHQHTYRTAAGHFFQSTWEGLMYSPDGAYNTWTMVPGAPTASVGVAGDGTHVWTSYAGPWQAPCPLTQTPNFEGSETSPASPMKKMVSPTMRDGALFMAYDPVHKLLFSSNFCGGLWRFVVP